jgi:hypothetical protein
MTMQQSPNLSVPAGRIINYRNSQPRSVRLFGLGEKGARIVDEVAAQSRPNVAVLSSRKRVGWSEIVGDGSGAETNMVVIVCAEGDQIFFNGDENKPRLPVTFVVLQEACNALIVANENFARARNRCDLFVTTSDADYVHDLIGNLAS